MHWLNSKISIFFLIILVFGPIRINSQSVATYTSTRNTGVVYTSINVTGNAFDSWRNTTSFTQDDNRSDFTDIGFDFWYNGVRYTQFSVSTNGFLDFSASLDDGGPAVDDFGYNNAAFSSNVVANSTNPAIAPFYDDLTAQGGVSALGNSIKYALSGAAPNRTLTIEWINMAVYLNVTPSLNFQVKLVENIGVIFMNYGVMNTGTQGFSYSMGLNAQTMTGPTLAQLKELQVVNGNTFNNTAQSFLSVMPTANSQYVFTPAVPTAAAGSLAFTAVGQTGMTVNWPNWATNEVGYVIYNSIDNITFNFVTQTGINAVNSIVSGLSPGTPYFWKVHAVTEGCLSAALTASMATTNAGNKVSIASTSWSTATTWTPNGVPTIADNVTIANGHTVVIDVNSVCNNLTVGQGVSGVLAIGNNNAARIVGINGNIVINTGATFSVNAASNAVHSLTFPGNITNNGKLNFASDAGSLCNITFNKNGNQTISGVGGVTTFNLVTLNMGTSINNILDIQTPNFVAPNDFLTLVNGTFKLSTTGASNLTPYTVTSTIPQKGGVWLNSALSTINNGGSLTMYGNITVSNGIFNVGNAANEDLLSNGGFLTVNGGTLNIAAKYYAVGINNLSKFTISGGNVIVPSISSTVTTIAPFQIAGAGSQFNMSGGSLIIPREGGNGAQNLGFINTGTSGGSVTGGTLQIGTAASPTAQIIQINSSFPVGNVLVNSANVNATIVTNSLSVINDITLNTGTLTASNLDVSLGKNWTNNGGLFVPGTGTVLFTGAIAQSIFKTGGETFNNITFSNAGNKTLLSAITGNTLTINAGSLTASNFNITLSGNWVNNGGVFVPGTSTVLFPAATAQSIFKSGGETFNNITFSGAANKTLLSAISGNTLTINAGTLTTNNFNISLIGNWANNGGLFVPGTNTVLFNGATAQSILKTGGETFNNITFSNAGNKTLLSRITANNLTLNAGTLTSSNFNIILTGNWTNNGGLFVPGTNTVLFTAATPQSIFKSGGETFNNITLSSTGNKTLLSPISGNTLTINAGSLTANSNSITLTGNWANNGGLFVPGTGTVLFTGAAAQTLFKAGGETFNDITFSNAGNKTLLSAISGNTLTINSGSLTSGTFSITLTGDWVNNGGIFVPGTNTVLFTSVSAQTLFKSGGEIFNNVTFSNSGTKTLLSAITGSNVLINVGSDLDVNTTNNQITVKGNFTNSGTFNSRSGLVFLNGTVAQSIGGTTTTNFYDLTLNNNAGANITNAENLIRTLTLNNGTFNTNAKVFTMVSTATNTARIAQITGTGDIIGNVTVQRFAPGGYTGWALIGTPISSALTFQDWDDDMPISCNSCPDGSASGFLSIYYYNEAAAGSYSSSASYVPLTAITNPITANRGYWVYLGNGATSTTPITIDVTGTVRKFNNAIPLSKTNTGSVSNDGWNLIHNPYPSPIKWSSLRNANANVDNAIYIFNADLNGGTGATAAFVNGISSPAIGSGGIGDTIPMCQGFQIHCSAATVLNALESNKVSGNPTFLKLNQSSAVASVQPLIRLNLNGPTSFHDETVLYIQPGATDNFDTEFDAIKMAGQDPSSPLITLMNGTNEFQINGVDPTTPSFSFPLKTTTGHTGTYTISLANFNSFPMGACFSLYDTFTGITTDLKISNYVFTLNSSTTVARFTLNITINPLNVTSTIAQPNCLNPNIGAITAVGNNSGPWNYYWKDDNGVIIKTSLNKATSDTLLNLYGGNYSLDINTVGQCDNNGSNFSIDIIDGVTAQFTTADTVFMSNGGIANFNNYSVNSVNNSWDFGDSFGFSSGVNPSYNYFSAGIYTVSLIATSNSGCLDTAYTSIVVLSDITTGLTAQNIFGILLLKTIDQNEYLLQGIYNESSVLNIKLFDALGKLVLDFGYFNTGEISLPINLKNYKSGIYFLNMVSDKTNTTIKLPVK